jgi:hypothetical protein
MLPAGDSAATELHFVTVVACERSSSAPRNGRPSIAYTPSMNEPSDWVSTKAVGLIPTVETSWRLALVPVGDLALSHGIGVRRSACVTLIDALGRLGAGRTSAHT